MPNSSPHYRAVVFDLDGTLLDTLADIADAANSVLAQHGFGTHTREAYRQFVGEGVAVLFQRALPPDHRTETVAGCVAGFRTAYGRNWHVHTKPYPGIRELLDCLAGRALKLAVLSNKPHDFTRACVAHFFPDTPFALVLGQREGVPRKPDPAGAAEIAQQLGIPAKEFLYLGDSGLDVQTSLRAGMRPVGAAWGFRSIGELRAAGASDIITEPAELLRYLDSPGDR